MNSRITDKMFSIHTDDECFYIGIDKPGNDKSKKRYNVVSVSPYQCCPTTKDKASARLSVMGDAYLGNSKAHENKIMFTFVKEEEEKPATKPKGTKAKAPVKQAPSVEERKPKKEKEERETKTKEAPATPKKEKREREVKEKEPKDSKDKDSDKKDKKGKDKKDKGKHTQGDDGFFKLGDWW